MDDWVIPVVQGTLQIEPCHIEGYNFDFILISRRSRERAGKIKWLHQTMAIY